MIVSLHQPHADRLLAMEAGQRVYWTFLLEQCLERENVPPTPPSQGVLRKFVLSKRISPGKVIAPTGCISYHRPAIREWSYFLLNFG
jgi:hypothetical protein